MLRMEIERELAKVSREEKSFLKKSDHRDGRLLNKLEEKVPEKLEDTLNSAFQLAFEAVFRQGSELIDKAVSKKGKSGLSNAIETTGTIVEGAGMGLLGVGIPDIPVFTAVVLRSVYQEAQDNGFSYESKTEQMFVLKLIECGLSSGEDTEKLNTELDELAESIDREGYVYYGLLTDQIRRTSDALSADMLYMKFVQGIPIVGAAGGISNAVTLNRIRKFASIKYRKRKFMNMVKR